MAKKIVEKSNKQKIKVEEHQLDHLMSEKVKINQNITKTYEKQQKSISAEFSKAEKATDALKKKLAVLKTNQAAAAQKKQTKASIQASNRRKESIKLLRTDLKAAQEILSEKKKELKTISVQFKQHTQLEKLLDKTEKRFLKDAEKANKKNEQKPPKTVKRRVKNTTKTKKVTSRTKKPVSKSTLLEEMLPQEEQLVLEDE